jgi:predicted nucleic acid-binding protein
MAEDPPEPPRITRDPGDDYLVALAVDAGAEVLVSGDRDLIDLDVSGVKVLTPRTFLESLETGSV